MIPLSELETFEFVNRGIESSTQIAAAAANVAPVTLVIEMSLQRPPELYHRFTPRVTRLSIVAPWTIGAEDAPEEIPIPYLQVVDEPCKSCPPPSITMSLSIGDALSKRSIATLSALLTTRLLITGLLPYTVIPYSLSEIVRLSSVEPLLLEVELKTTPWCFPEIDSMTMGEDRVPSMVILPSTPSLSPSPRRMVVPAWTTSTWLDWTR